MGEVVNFRQRKGNDSFYEFKEYHQVSISFNDLIGEAKIEYFAHCLHCDKHLEDSKESFCSNKCQEAYYVEFNKWMLERNE